MVGAVLAEVLQKVLNLNTAAAPGKDPAELYKVLVLDRFSKDIVAPLLRLNDLRRNGVTLHLMLEAERQPIPDVPAVYLVQPSPSNVDRVVQDAAFGLYETMHINFTSNLPSKQLEQLATGAVKANAVQRVAKLFDQYVSFIALEPSMFSLGLPSSYIDLNDPASGDAQIEVRPMYLHGWLHVYQCACTRQQKRASSMLPAREHAHLHQLCMSACLLLFGIECSILACGMRLQAAVNSIVDGLFSVCVTLGVVPVIRCPRGGAAEHVAGVLDQRLRCGCLVEQYVPACIREGELIQAASMSFVPVCSVCQLEERAASLVCRWDGSRAHRRPFLGTRSCAWALRAGMHVMHAHSSCTHLWLIVLLCVWP